MHSLASIKTLKSISVKSLSCWVALCMSPSTWGCSLWRCKTSCFPWGITWGSCQLILQPVKVPLRHDQAFFSFECLTASLCTTSYYISTIPRLAMQLNSDLFHHICLLVCALQRGTPACWVPRGDLSYLCRCFLAYVEVLGMIVLQSFFVDIVSPFLSHHPMPFSCQLCVTSSPIISLKL